MTTLVCEAGQFQKFIAMIRTINNECRIHVSEDGLKTLLVDTANIGMGAFHLKSSACVGYKFDSKAHPEAIGFDLPHIAKIISQAKKNTPLTIKLKKDRISISYDEITSCVGYTPLDTIRKDPNPPTIVLDTEFTFDGSLFRKLAGVIPTDKVIISVKNKMATISSDGGTSKLKMMASISAEGTARAIYSWDLLGELKTVLVGTCVTAELKTDHPIRLKTETQGIVAEFLFAPRIEAD
jgi:DNA polymerase III sliding clamp (beta) subunit (PCNA family)